MAERITVVIAPATSATSVERGFEEQVIAQLLSQPSVDLTLIEDLSQLEHDATGLLCLEGIKGPMVIVTAVPPSVAHALLADQQIQGRSGGLQEGKIIVAETGPQATLSPGVYDPMRRTIFCLEIHDFDDPQDLCKAVTMIQNYLADQRVTAGRSDFTILSASTTQPSKQTHQSHVTESASAVRPMPRRAEPEDNGQPSEEQDDIDDLVDELDEMEL